MEFESILFADPKNCRLSDSEPQCFRDLNLDQVTALIVSGRQEFGLKPFFYTLLKSPEEIRYRHEVFRDLEKPAFAEGVRGFSKEMRAVRRCLHQAEEQVFRAQKERWLLDAVSLYCGAVKGLADALLAACADSAGIKALNAFLDAYLGSPAFVQMNEEAQKLQLRLGEVKYCLRIQSRLLTVTPYRDEADYSREVNEAFAPFGPASGKDYREKFAANIATSHVEAGILNFVTKLYPEVFASLSGFCGKLGDFMHPGLVRFDREVQFYLAVMEYRAVFERAGLPFCYPEVSDADKEIAAADCYDAALAYRNQTAGKEVVCNDFYLSGRERVMVVTGPNQGGKTTFARAFGQLHYLAGLGCPVPAARARLFLPDKILTHFEKAETMENRRSKLQDDLYRLRDILSELTEKSVVIINELFSSTTVSDGARLSQKTLDRMLEKEALCIYITFIDALSCLNEQTVSYVGLSDPENPLLRTYKILRKPADGKSYALSIAEKYRLTYDCLRGRLS